MIYTKGSLQTTCLVRARLQHRLQCLIHSAALPHPHPEASETYIPVLFLCFLEGSVAQLSESRAPRCGEQPPRITGNPSRLIGAKKNQRRGEQFHSVLRALRKSVGGSRGARARSTRCRPSEPVGARTCPGIKYASQLPPFDPALPLRMLSHPPSIAPPTEKR